MIQDNNPTMKQSIFDIKEYNPKIQMPTLYVNMDVLLLAIIQAKMRRLDKMAILVFSIAILASILICLFADQSGTITPAVAHLPGSDFPY